jgi:insertion element IS1 protein InsB
MSRNASGVRDTARVLHISTDTVLSEPKKKETALASVNSKRLVRKTICFSKSIQMHNIVIGLFVNRSTFGRTV